MRKKLFIVVALILAFSLVLGACGGSKPAAQEENNAQSEAPVVPNPEDDNGGFADSPEVTLILTQHDPDQSLPGQYCHAWADMVFEKSKGRIKVEVNNGGSLAKPAESLDKVRDGSVDLAWGLQSFYPGQFPLTDGLSLPYLPYTSAAQASEKIMSVYDAGLLDTEYSDVKVILLRANSDTPIITAKKKLEKAEDLKGLTIRATAAPLVSWLEAFGAGGQGCPINELFQNLQQGTFDGALTDWHGVDSFSLYEVAKYYADEQVQYNTYYFLMNQKKYDGLADDLKAIIDECSGAAALDVMKGAWDDMSKTAKEKAEAAGNEVYKLSDDEHKKLEDAGKVIQADWVSKNGDAGKQIYDKLVG